MTKFAIVAAGVSVAALALAACTPPRPHHHPDAALKTISSLDCPDTQGELTLKDRAGDGKSCRYADDSGGEVTLQLIDLAGGDAKAALAPIEAQLKAEMPAAAAGKAGGAAGNDNDRVDIDLPGIHIHANGKDDAKVDAGGVAINAQGQDGTVRVGKSVTVNNGGAVIAQTGPGGAGVSINAQDNGAEIRVNEPGSGVRLFFLRAGDQPGPHGYRMVGYEARGPAGGPLAVASMKTKSDDHDNLKDDARDLLRRNVGG